MNDAELTNLRLRKLGFIFQSFNLVGVLDVRQNVEFPLLLQGGLTKAERTKRVDEMVDKVGLTPQLKQRPNELSGGQRQRVAIARALVTRPLIVLADEPTANLDSATGRNIIELMRTINRTDNTTFIFSTHDHQVMEHASRIVRIVDGKIADDGLSSSAKPAAEPQAHAEAEDSMFGLLLTLSIRNLFSHWVKSLIVGAIMVFGTFLVVVGTSLLDTIERTMSESITSSLAGHVQVYDKDARDDLALFGGGSWGLRTSGASTTFRS